MSDRHYTKVGLTRIHSCFILASLKLSSTPPLMSGAIGRFEKPVSNFFRGPNLERSLSDSAEKNVSARRTGGLTQLHP